jgi:uncharacterized protein with NAD-binding domain and iron-sulfur cluster
MGSLTAETSIIIVGGGIAGLATVSLTEGHRLTIPDR